ncbi:MAG: hypothetical protein WAN87_04145 [Thermoplasmata archaeon]
MASTVGPRIACVGNSNTSGTGIAFDPADGYLYLTGYDTITIVKPPCTFVRSLFFQTDAFIQSIAYDPLTKQMVAVAPVGEDCNPCSHLFIVQGLQKVKMMDLGYYTSNYTKLQWASGITWDSAVGALLISNSWDGGIDILYISQTGGSTKTQLISNDFDQERYPDSIQVADGYVFAPGFYGVDVFNARTLTFLGSYPVLSNSYCLACGYVTWDPVNHTEVLGVERINSVAASRDVVFLEANAIPSRAFSYHDLEVHHILEDGVGGLTYSPADHDLYIGAAEGPDVWYVTASGTLGHIYVGYVGGGYNVPMGLAFDPINHDVYVCGNALVAISP